MVIFNEGSEKKVSHSMLKIARNAREKQKDNTSCIPR